MKLNNVRIQSILKRFPDVENIFQWYEIDLTEETLGMKLEDACEAFNIEAEDLLLDLDEAIQESRNTDWLGPDEEESQWTEGLTEESEKETALSLDDETVDAPTDMSDVEGSEEDYEY